MVKKAKRLGDQLREIKRRNTGPQGRATLIIKKTLIDLGTAIVFDTAVDKGVARGNWVLGFGSINFERGPIDKDGSSTAGRIAEETNLKFTIGPDFYMTSTLAYIGVLEYGGYPGVGPKTVEKNGGIFPKQADEGMVRINVARFRPTVEKIAKELAR